MKSRKKCLLVVTLLISLTACSERDVAIHTPGFDYLHKDLAEERETIVIETKGNIVSAQESYRKLMARYKTDITAELRDLQSQNQIKSVVKSSKLMFPLKEPMLLYSKYSERSPAHRGDDFTPPDGKGGREILAAHSGKVIDVGGSANDNLWGYRVFIEGEVGGEKVRTIYGHLQKKSHLKVGDIVKQGDVIGYMGTTGPSTGNHLHFEVHIYDPLRSKIKSTVDPMKLARIQNASWFMLSAGPWVPTDPALYLSEYEPNTPTKTLVSSSS